VLGLAGVPRIPGPFRSVVGPLDSEKNEIEGARFGPLVPFIYFVRNWSIFFCA